MNHTQDMAEKNSLTRRVLTIREFDEKNYQCHVEISNAERAELNYYFVPRLTDISVVPSVVMDLATHAFMGQASRVAEKIEQQVEMAITSNPETKEVPSGEKSIGQESTGKKTRKRNQKSGSQEQVTDIASSSAQDGEMEPVESPFSANPATQESEVEEAKPSTAEPYNREDKASKALFATFITKLHKGSKEWKTREDLKEISTKLHEMPFIEKDGSIHPSFEVKCKGLFGLK